MRLLDVWLYDRLVTQRGLSLLWLFCTLRGWVPCEAAAGGQRTFPLLQAQNFVSALSEP